MRIDINNLLTVASFAKAKNIARNTVKAAIRNNRLAVIQVDDIEFIVINKTSANYQPERIKRNYNFVKLEIKPPIHYESDKLLRQRTFAKLKKVTAVTVNRWIKGNRIDTVTIDGVEFVLINEKSASIHSDNFFKS